MNRILEFACIQATLDRRPIHSGAYRMQINSASPPVGISFDRHGGNYGAPTYL